ncbi:MAG: sigma 54-interacting transcriptional regulator [Bacillota bacterium]|nr:sigma 54-interacting transcriptional regulator [Bacillota bacterium]
MKDLKLLDIFDSEFLEKKPKLHKDLMDFFDSLADGILITDSKGKIIIYNRAKEIQENRNRKEMLGKFTWQAYGYSGPEKSEHYKVLKSQKPILNQYSAHSKVDGVERFISYSTYPIIMDGQTIAVYTVGRNEDSLHQVLVDTIEKKRQHQQLLEKHSPVYTENGTRYNFSDIVGESEEIKNVINIGQNLSFLDNSILIIGETGTGKEVLSQSIHNFGDRAKEPFIGINCSAIPENLLESMLFGTVRGAYTGALDSVGLFEKAKAGTLFLDDINTMAMGLQAKLLRAIQERRVTRLGDSKAYPIECRIVAATNEDPFELIQAGKLREDLYYRIAGFTINIPPLRERKKDIIVLVEHFIRRYNKPLAKPYIGVDFKLKKILDNYPWPGNIRELENLVENMLVNSSGDSRYLTVENIPHYLEDRFLGKQKRPQQEEKPEKLTYNELVDQYERKLLKTYLEKNKWNYSKTARDLDLNRNSLLYKIKRLGLEND